MAKTYLGYLNNFPRENAVKDQKFEGNKALEKELLQRKIIGDIVEVEATVVLNSATKIKELYEEIRKLKEDGDDELLKVLEDLKGENATLKEATTRLEGENATKIEQLVDFLEEAIDSSKSTVPEGYERRG